VFPAGVLEPVVPAGVLEPEPVDPVPDPVPAEEVPEPVEPDPDDPVFGAAEVDPVAVVTVADDAAGQLSRRSEASWLLAWASAVSSEVMAALAASKVAALSGVARALALERAVWSAATFS
jgi:hypothetical protein